MNSKRIIVFAPHPDDETFGCGGTIAKKIAEGYEVLIVVMTDGRFLFKDLSINEDPSPEEVKEIRKKEILRAAHILGVPRKNVIFLDFVDTKLQENEEIAQEKVIEILRSYLPSEVYFAGERDWHPDHRATNRIVIKAIQKLGTTPKKYAYVISHKFDRIYPIFDFFFSLFKHNVISIEVSEFLLLKRAAVKEFKSELIAASHRKHRSNEGFEKFLKRKEKFYICK